jgi:hypothetical protein
MLEVDNFLPEMKSLVDKMCGVECTDQELEMHQKTTQIKTIVDKAFYAVDV